MGEKPTSRPVAFYAVDGSRLAGVLTLSDVRPAPAVLLCQGLSGVKHLVLPEVAARFADAGFASLAFDYRGYGESEGERGWVLPESRIEDAVSALAWLSAQPEVDASRIGVYGLSLGGPIALGAAASDERVRAVVSVSGPANGELLMREMRTEAEYAAFRRRILADRARFAATGESEEVAITEIFPFSETFLAKYAALTAEGSSAMAPESPPRFKLASADAVNSFHGEDAIPHIAAPILFVSGADDDVATVEQTGLQHRLAGAGSQMVIVPGHDHVDLDAGAGLELQMGLALDWFRRHVS